MVAIAGEGLVEISKTCFRGVLSPNLLKCLRSICAVEARSSRLIIAIS